LTDLSGAAASAEVNTSQGVKAGVGLADSEGYKIKYVVADAGSTPAGALSAAQKLVEQDHVFAVIAISGLTFAAAPYLASNGIPVVGDQTDASEWLTDRNMFSAWGSFNFAAVETQAGLTFKLLGAKVLGTLGYAGIPSSAEASEAAAVSAQTAGLKVGYQNAAFPLGSTNVAPVALAMKSAGVDGVDGAVETGTNFALISALRQDGVKLKVALLADGYGSDLTSAGSATEQEAQGVYFGLSFEPAELHTAATEKFMGALKKYGGLKGDEPDQNQYLGYLAVAAFVDGLKAAGHQPTQASFINAMLGIRSFNGDGLYGSHSIGFAMDQRGIASGPDNCEWVVRFSGTSFHRVPGADPLCGTTLAGKTVSLPS
jgi:branched-chain amino acid transport system substrate-binding protein